MKPEKDAPVVEEPEPPRERGALFQRDETGKKVDAALWADLLGDDSPDADDPYRHDLVYDGHHRLVAAEIMGAQGDVPVALAVPVSEVAAEPVINLPMGEYDDFDDCVAKNQDKDSPEGYCAVIHKAINGSWPVDGVINLPDISDVSFPSMVGAIPSKPSTTKRKRKPVDYKGVRLSRMPMKFEAQVLALADIPRRLDAAVLHLMDHHDETREVMDDVAKYGAVEVLRELVRQGAPDYILTRPPVVNVEACWRRLADDRDHELKKAFSLCDAHVTRRRLSADRHDAIVKTLFDRREPAILKRYANRAVNDAFMFGRSVSIDLARRPHVDVVSLAKKHRDEGGRFETLIDAVNAGDIAVDGVFQTAVLDNSTCDECEAVDGEEMELGSARQLELHPPYVLCLGWDRCRCVQIALLENDMEINVDEIDEDTIE